MNPLVTTQSDGAFGTWAEPRPVRRRRVEVRQVVDLKFVDLRTSQSDSWSESVVYDVRGRVGAATPRTGRLLDQRA
ncbi:hypothetical protein [Congregicoccus parvus]|uniref:hypothetical protein n=1 Tax=Congregicoccus parvus TaxID=3081749 RepID=UPI003FA56CA2